MVVPADGRRATHVSCRAGGAGPELERRLAGLGQGGTLRGVVCRLSA